MKELLLNLWYGIGFLTLLYAVPFLIIYHRGGWLDDYVRFMKNRKSVQKQRTFCYCPTCNHDLCNSFNCLVSSDINDFLDNLDRKRENRKKFAERFTRTRVDLKEDD